MSIDDKNLSLRNILKNGIYNITFTKVDGSERTMPCTLDNKIVPPAPIVEDKKTKEHKPDTLSVWCTDAASWRSFRVNNLISIQEPNAILNQNSLR